MRPIRIHFQIFVVAVSLLSTSSATTVKSSKKEQVVELSFDEYLLQFDKQYDSQAEFSYRKAIFEQNVDIIRKHNAKKDSNYYTLGVNHFADRLPSELPLGFDKAQHKAWKTKHFQQHINTAAAATQRRLRVNNQDQTEIDAFNLPYPDFLFSEQADLKVPKEIDWRAKGHVITPVKHQGMCGSCWAFAAIAAMESHLALATGKLFVLSVQELVSCAPNPNWCGGQGGCNGSTGELAYQYIAQNGILDEWHFSYQSFHGNNVTCSLASEEDSPISTLKDAVASVAGFSSLPANEYQTLLRTVGLVGPVVVGVAASGWSLYHGGVFDDDNVEHPDINHLVVVEGYGTDQETGQDYWLVRNSWGPLWGEDGYIRLKRVDPATLDDPDSICKMDITPRDGTACARTDDGQDIDPEPEKVCGTSGILFDPIIPAGAYLL
jgi:cathepsin L